VTHAPFVFESDPYRTELATRVAFCGIDKARPFVVLEETLFYPEGGGQPADQGSIGEAAVVDVQKVSGTVRHYLDRPISDEGPVTARLDWRRRFDHMQQHTGQHLLTAVATDRFGWETTAFHLGPEVSDIELAATSLSAADLAALEEAVAAEIRAAHPVSGRRVAPEELGSLGVRTRGLPEGHTGDVRLVEIAGIDLNTCGGTHLRSTAEIELVKLLGTEPIRGGTRLFFVAGGRVRRRLAAHEARNASLRTLLGAGDAELPAAAAAKLDHLQEAVRRGRALEEELIGALVTSIAALPGPATLLHFDGKGSDFLQRLARQLATLAPQKVSFLTATDGGQSFFALGLGELLALDLQKLGKEIVALLGGRGGGSGRVFQGKAPSLEGMEKVARLIDQTTGGS